MVAQQPPAPVDAPRRGVAVDVAVRIPLNGPAGVFDLDVAFSIEPGAFVALVGPSGVGKTTLLRILAGLTRPREGLVHVDGAVWTDIARNLHVPTSRRSIGFVFQDYALFPNMSVRRHVEYALGTRQSRQRVDELLQLAGLQNLAAAFPAALSGGQKQRLALIRALARAPALLMLDEPLSALDPAMRRLLQDELRTLHHRFGTTTLMVSHDTSDILRLADRVIRLEEGCIVFDGAPARSFGLAGPTGTLEIEGIHLEGPDAEGYAIVLVAGMRRRIRYRGSEQHIAPGDAVLLLVDEAAMCASPGRAEIAAKMPARSAT